MPLTDVLAVASGILLGTLISIPIAVVITISVRHQPDRRIRDLGATWQQPDIVIDAPGREIMVLDVAGREVLYVVS